MLAEQRYKEIMQIIRNEGSVKASSLKKILQVSAETIRRDLENMEEQGLLRRTHGGAMQIEDMEINESYAYKPFGQREKSNPSEKLEVASLAADYIMEGQSVALDSGTTSLELARIIKHRFKNLTVVTNSLAIANELTDVHGITLILTGGVYKHDEQAFNSDVATLIFSKLSIQTFFLTTCGISIERGITYQRMDEIIVQEKMMEASDKTIIIADSSKLGVNSLVKMCDIHSVDMIITDSKAKSEQIQPFIDAGLKIVKP